MKIVMALALLGIIGALFMAGKAMLQDGRNGAPKTNRMARALAWRVGLSIALFLFVLLAYMLGWIHPTGVPISAG